MTADKDFKRLVRAHAREFGLSYASARSRLRSSANQRREERRVMEFNRVTPILRFFDEAKAKEFYVDYLGMTVDWEHRFEPQLPLYMQVSRAALVLHLSEHHGDGTPGTHVLINTIELAEFHAELLAKSDVGHNRPGLDTDEIGTWVVVHDPFGNVLKFLEQP
jgi:catechol 2,3-dioxygenase-like lactoylglutathione lyase family enzyme